VVDRARVLSSARPGRAKARGPFAGVVVRVTAVGVALGVLAVGGCSSGGPAPGPTTPPPPTLPATRPASSTTAVQVPVTDAGPGPVCDRFATERLAALQGELDRLDPVPLADLAADDAAADLSDGYYLAAARLDEAAGAAGCRPDDLARAVLDRAGTLRATGPVAASAKSSFIDDNAWRVSRSLAGPARGSVIVSGPAVPDPGTTTFTDCDAVGRAWVRVIEAMAAALDGVGTDEYLALADVRSVDARSLSTASEPIGFDIDGLPETLGALGDASDRLACDDEGIAAELLAGLPEVRVSSAAASIFVADQVDVALLLVLGF
jgi:hypothetical protein